jgi:hypothetical protein
MSSGLQILQILWRCGLSVSPTTIDQFVQVRAPYRSTLAPLSISHVARLLSQYFIKFINLFAFSSDHCGTLSEFTLLHESPTLFDSSQNDEPMDAGFIQGVVCKSSQARKIRRL